ncbi:HAD family hydrolase [Haloplanus halobius]|uniref:HAD family hydrolase n=1 Tax=Haloplanus halobius TaxID=2934938 RepID=UPI00200F443C|nr:HAD family hydrolase [Haloplanus sp. XH21]
MVAHAYDFWLFDLDGTLVDVEPSYARDVFDRVGDRIDRTFSDHEVEVLWHGLSGAREAQLVEWGVDPDTFWDALHDAENPADRAEATYLHDDAAFVADLDRPVGLVTHCQEYLVDPVLDHVGIRDWFDTVVSCTGEIGWKPDPAPVYLAMSDIGVDDEDDGILAGDGPNDIGAAWNAGLDGVHVERHGPDRRGRCVLGDYRVESLDELRRMTTSDDAVGRAATPTGSD